MSFLDKWDAQFKKAPLDILERGFSQLCDKEVELEFQLEAIREAKARFLIEVDLRVHKKHNN